MHFKTQIGEKTVAETVKTVSIWSNLWRDITIEFASKNAVGFLKAYNF